MVRENHPQRRQQAKFERKLNQRASYDRILIVCEGGKTEPLYFEEIRKTYRLQTANIKVLPSQLGTEPVQVVKSAKELFLNGDAFRGIRPRAFEKVFAVFDRDDHPSYLAALDLAISLNNKLRNDNKQKTEFSAIVSVPCFELWLLLHYEDIQYRIHRDEVRHRLEQHIPGYDKGASGYFSITKDNLLVTADKRARHLATLYNASSGIDPYTDIGKLVALLIGLGR